MDEKAKNMNKLGCQRTLLLFLSLTVLALPVNAANISNQKGNKNKTVLIVVNGNIFYGIEKNLSIFINDLTLGGFQTSTKLVNSATSPSEIRALLQSYYADYAIHGAILIGNIKAASR
jgi:hypothetical protein